MGQRALSPLKADRRARRKESYVDSTVSTGSQNGAAQHHPNCCAEVSPSASSNMSFDNQNQAQSNAEDPPVFRMTTARNQRPRNQFVRNIEEPFFQGDRLNIIVVGSGFAGLSAAISCARQGFQVTLLERGTGLSPHGDNITFGANAAKVLLRWGLGEEMWSKSGKGGWWLFKEADGGRLREEDLRDFPSLYGSPILHGHRAQFLGVLGVEARMLRVNIRPCTEVVDYLDSPDKPAVVTRTGEVIAADVIIVADGVHSPGRRRLATKLRSPAVRNTTKGYSVHRAAISANTIHKDPLCSHMLDGCVRTWLGNDAHAIVAPIDGGRQISFGFIHREEHDNKASTDWGDRRPIREVLSLLQGWDPTLIQVISHFDTCLNWSIVEDEPVDEWVTKGGRMVFIGDSVHPLMPTSFQGGSQAIEDGATLGIAFAMAGGSAEGVPLALKTFQAIRHPRVTKAHQIGVKQRDLWHGYASTKSPACLDLLVAKMYDHDAELYALANFERVAQSFDASFKVEGSLRSKLLQRIGSMTEGWPVELSLYEFSKQPVH